MRSIQESIISMLKEHSTRKHLAVAVCMIAIATAFAVFWTLRISGITLASDDPTCGMQEHTHTDACYDWVATVTDGTEEVESTDDTKITEAIEIIETTENEEATDKASVEAEESASEEGTDASTAEETVAETVAGETETGTEAVTETCAEDATEEMTEELTEEETEAPQPGDIKVVDGVTYVYELVCGLEEHVHTDECYESEASEDSELEDDSDAAEEAKSENGVSEDTVDNETVSEEGSDELLLTDEATKTESSVTAGLSRSLYNTRSLLSGTFIASDGGISIASDDGISVASSSDLEYGIALASEEESTTSNGGDSSSSNLLTTANTEGTYYFADTVSVAEAYSDPDAEYIAYTIINGKYYIVTAKGNLVECTGTGTNSDGTLWIDTTSSYFENMLWNLSGSLDNTTSAYTSVLYNSATGHYLAADTAETTTSDDWWVAGTEDTYIGMGNRYEMSGDGIMIFTITCTSGSGAAFNLEVFDDNGSYITTGSLGDAWLAGNATGNSAEVDSTVTDYDNAVGGSNNTNNTLSTGDVYTVTVERSGQDYVVTYYDIMTAEIFRTFTAYSTNFSENTYVHFIAQVGTFETSAEYVTDTVITTSYTTTKLDSLTIETGFTSSTSGTCSYTGDGNFDITYTFKNSSNGGIHTNETDKTTKYYDNFTLEINSGSVFWDLRADSGNWKYLSSETMTIQETEDLYDFLDGAAGAENSWIAAMQAGTDCTVRIVRTDDDIAASTTFTIYVTITLTEEISGVSQTSTILAYTATFTDTDLYGQEITVYLTGEFCTLTDIVLTDNNSGVQSTTYETVKAYSRYVCESSSLYVTVESDGYGWTGYIETAEDGNLALIGEYNSSGYSSIEWQNSSNTNVSGITSSSSVTSTVFFFAKVRVCTVHFDGTNDGLLVYRNAGTSTVTSYQMDSEGEYFYVDVPAISNTSYYYVYSANTWYDIYNNATYLAETTVQVPYSTGGDNITVCYADWKAVLNEIDTTDTHILPVRTSTTSTGEDAVVDTSSFVTTYMFDYSELMNLNSVVLDAASERTSSGHSETWVGATLGGTNILGNTSWSFLFMNNMQLHDAQLYYVRSNMGSFGSTDTVIQGIPTAITAQYSGFLDDLFGTDTSLLGKTYMGEGNYLFQYDDDNGYYYYDSSRNAAFYSEENQRFYLYDYTVRIKYGGSADDFVPYNYGYITEDTDGKYVYAVGTESNYTLRYCVNYFFGMSTSIDFYLPDVPGTTNGSGGYGNQSVADTDMVFKFSGDDDLWVYLDGELVLDLGGTHDKVYGEINFSTGEVSVVYEKNYSDKVTTDSNGVVELASGETADITTTLSGVTSGSHTLQVYYLERGGGQSNIAMYYSLSSPSYSVKLQKVDENNTGKSLDATFTYYTDATFETLASLLT